VTGRFHQYRIKVNASVISTLSTAEKLYADFIYDKKAIPGFDYSCISILYFQALENLLNITIYEPYLKDYLNPNRVGIYNCYQNRIPNDYLPFERNRNNMSFYFARYNSAELSRFKEEMTLGSFPYIFQNTGCLTRLSEFLRKIFQCDRLNQELLYQLGDDLSYIARRRNDAAHGSKILDDKSVVEDRTLVYVSSPAYSKQIRAVIFTFLSLFGK
jgi:hypothetical protein